MSDDKPIEDGEIVTTESGKQVRFNVKPAKQPALMIYTPLEWMELLGVLVWLGEELERAQKRGDVPSSARVSFEGLHRAIDKAESLARIVTRVSLAARDAELKRASFKKSNPKK